MGIFKKTIKYSKDSKDLNNQIKNLDEDLKKTGVISNVDDVKVQYLEESKSKKNEVKEEVRLQEEKLYTWRDYSEEHTEEEIEEFVEEIREKHRKLSLVENSLESIKIREAQNIFKELYQDQVEEVVEKYVSAQSKDILLLREDLFLELQKKPTVDVGALEEKINLLSIKYRRLSEAISDPSKNKDPLSDQSPITLEQLKNHYQLLVGRLQEKLATVGGGGEVRLRYLDDVVGIQTNPSVYDGKFLKYDHTIGKFIFETVSGSGGGSGEYAYTAGFSTYSGSAGFSTISAVSGFSTFATHSGVSTIASVAGFATNSTRAGVATFSSLAGSAGFSTVASIAGFATVATHSGVSTIASVAGFATNATRAGIATAASYAFISGFSTYAANVGFATFSGVAGFATVATRAGLATLTPYSYTAGFSTYAGNVGFATFSGVSGFATVANRAGISTSVIGGIVSVTQLSATGVSTFSGIATHTASLFASNISATGVITASSFSGSASNLTGLTGASANTYGNATAVPQIVVDANGRISSITNVLISGGGGGTGVNVLNSGSVIGFAGTVDFSSAFSVSSLSAGIVTANVISAPNAGFATFARWSGISTIASVSGFATNSSVSGFSTVSSVAGFASVATQSGVSTLATYTYTSGFSTYSGTSGFSTVSAVAGFATNATRSGISTAASYAFISGFSTYADNVGFATFAGIAGFATVATQAGIATSVVGGIANITSLNVSGVSTFSGIATHTASLFGSNVSITGVITAANFSGSGSNLTGLTGASANTYGNSTAVPQIVVDANGRITSISNVAITGGGGGGGGTGIFVNNGSLVGFAGTVDFNVTNFSVSPLSVGIVTATIIAAPNAGFATFARWAGISTTSSVSGFATVATQAGVATLAPYSYVSGFSTYAGNVGFATFSGIAGFATVATRSGVATLASYSYVSGFSTVSAVAGFATVTAVSGFATVSIQSGVSTIAAVAGFATVSTQAGIATNVISGVASISTLQVAGVSTFTTGPVIIGSATSTGTGTQRLQITGGLFVSGNVGIATSNPSNPFQVGSGSTVVLIDGQGELGINTTTPVTPLQVERFGVKSGFGTFTASAGITTDIDTFTISSTDFKTSEYTLHIQHSSGIQAQKILVMQNGSTAYSQEYAVMFDNSLIVSVGSTVSAGAMKLQVTPETGISGITTYRFTRQTML